MAGRIAVRLLQPVQPASSVDPAENVCSNCLRAVVLAHARIMKNVVKNYLFTAREAHVMWLPVQVRGYPLPP